MATKAKTKATKAKAASKTVKVAEQPKVNMADSQDELDAVLDLTPDTVDADAPTLDEVEAGEASEVETVEDTDKEPEATQEANLEEVEASEDKPDQSKGLVVRKGTRTDYERAKPKRAPVLPTKPIKTKSGSSTNAAALVFPSDRWGVTKDLRKAIATTASRVAGAEDKMKLVRETLEIGLAHMEAKFERDAAYRAELKAKAEAEAKARKSTKAE